MNWLFELSGWVGSVLVVWAYAAVALGKVSSDAMSYRLANLFGGILLMIFALYKTAYPPAIVNFIWATLAIVALIKKK